MCEFIFINMVLLLMPKETSASHTHINPNPYNYVQICVWQPKHPFISYLSEGKEEGS